MVVHRGYTKQKHDSEDHVTLAIQQNDHSSGTAKPSKHNKMVSFQAPWNGKLQSKLRACVER